MSEGYISGIIGVRPRTHSPLWRKIERIASARAAAEAVHNSERRAVACDLRRAEMSAEVKRLAKEYRAERARVALWRALPKQPYERILAEVAVKHGIPVMELVGPRRFKRLMPARWEATWRLYAETEMSLPAISKRIGGREHTTAFHAVKQYMKLHGITERPPHRMLMSTPDIVLETIRAGLDANGQCRISMTELLRRVGRPHSTVSVALYSLEERGLIIRTRFGRKMPCVYEIPAMREALG